ncbi:MAG: HD domain-containing protein [Chloroflexota bacterium]|nr:HD domain-containing protein [Chloroflexota bacterium]
MVEQHIIPGETLRLLQRAAQYVAERQRRPAYLVGGSLRNLLLNEPCVDWDIVIGGPGVQVARGLANALGGHYVHMHDKASRVVAGHGQDEIIIDIAPLIGNTIEDDLRQRDFTINAMAAPLQEIVSYLSIPGSSGEPVPLIDPLHGSADVHARMLRAVDEHVFQHDPLRMLRAVRLGARYHLAIEPTTAQFIKRDATLLPTVAGERIHDELYPILAPIGATEQLYVLDKLDLLTTLMPEFMPARGMPQPRPHCWDVLEHSLHTVDTLEQLASALQQGAPAAQQPLLQQSSGADFTEIQGLLQEARQQGIFQFADLGTPRMKLAALLHDIGKPATYSTGEDGAIHFYGHQQAGVPLASQIMKRLSTSTQDSRLAQLIAAHHMRPGQLGQDGPVTPRAIRRYFVDLGPTGIHVALLSLADHLATYGPQWEQRPPTVWERHLSVVRLLLDSYIRRREHFLPPQLISGNELMRRLQVEPGPIIGQLLEYIAEAQAEDRVHSKEEALWLAEEYLHPS